MSALSHEVPEQREQRRRALFKKAALSYAGRGWAVLPGPVCDGLTCWNPTTVEPLLAAQPVVLARLATTDPATVHSWWARYPHIILTRAGVNFDVLCAPTWLAATAAISSALRRYLGPIALCPDGARFLVHQGATVIAALADERGVRILPRGALITLPPSRVRSGSVSWWMTPEATGGQLGDAVGIQAALHAAIRTGQRP
ncbi:bifunctional DNA primase/polymerase [Amycolatopsis palatopharyngis]|uniref:bifunctional DNA primase/polymerase n=1 Tax=Amycolatopsis palatopharyngis TaxID=187982 RepID=UPI0013BEA737|nr:bifunctional DNA primase/polymerase [Amycolatopsis palatopharyngis]